MDAKDPTLLPITDWLLAWGEGDEASRERLMAALYDDLQRRAAGYMRHERQGHTLEPKALVNEVYLRLIDQHRVAWKNRSQFFGVAAQMMRRVLVDHARARLTRKRDGGQRLQIEDCDLPAGGGEFDLVALDDALSELAALDPRQSQVVELRYFAGLTIEGTAEALSLSPATVKREWLAARAWLYGRLRA